MAQKEIERKKFETKLRVHSDGFIEKQIFIDGEMLDWAVNISDFRDAARMGLQYKFAVQADIVKHFTESVSEVLGRKVSIDDIKTAIQTGWI